MENVSYVEGNVVIEEIERKIKITSNVINIWEKFIQVGILSREAGGVLIGRENQNDNNQVIEYCTEPMKKDKRLRTRFYRKDTKHIDFFTNLYKEKGEIYRYIGEWHTHPEDVPRYSNIDANNWKKIYDELGQKEQYHVIVGREKIVVWKYNVIGKIEKIGEIDWREIQSYANDNE